MTCIASPLVTILVPTHGRAKLVPEAIRSALAQSHTNIEVIVLDDASPDDTAAAIAAFSSDPRFRYVRHPANLGIAGNWRAGIGIARGDFFCLLHDDDTYEPHFVEALLRPLMADPTLAYTFCEHRIMDWDGRRLEGSSHLARFHRERLTKGPLRGETLVRAVLFDYSVPVGCSLFRRSIVPPDFIDDRAKGSIDYWLLYRILQTGYGAYYVNDPLMNYRVHSGGMSGSATTYMAEGHIFRLEAMLVDPQLFACRNELVALHRRTMTDYGIDLMQLGRRAEARRALWSALRGWPSTRTLAAFALACNGALGGKLLRRLRKKRE